MNKNIIKILVTIVWFSLGSIVLSVVVEKDKMIDTIKYNGKTYVLLEYNLDIFTYYHNNSSNLYYEEDEIHLVPHEKWDVAYFNGDLFILDKQVKKATKYYTDDDNYDWYIAFDDGDNIYKKSISIDKEELVYLYNIENNKDKLTITFNDIDMFADILKISKDELTQGIVTLALVEGNWYYKTETMTDDDREYVVKICDSLNNKINNLIDK